MDFALFVAVYLGATALLIFVMLFGELPMFIGTPVAGAHWLVTQGLCDGAEWTIRKVFGNRGVNAVEGVLEICCDRPNPTLQICYVVLISGGYYLYLTNVFVLLPSPFTPEYHMYTGTACVCLALGLFLAASVSDPGRVTVANAAALAALYPLDGAIWAPKTCATCALQRPARSKHCRVCNRCVPRFDHHCGWINNCVGRDNQHLFLAFLASNLWLCVYGVWLAVLAVAGDMERRGRLRMSIWDTGTNRPRLLLASPRRLMEFCIFYYPLPVMLVVFMAVAGVLMSGFLFYQLYLIARGRTTYETFRWTDYEKALIEQAVKDAPPRARPGRLSRLLSVFVNRHPTVQLPLNIYNKGLVHNFVDVLFPRLRLQAVQAGQAAPPTDNASSKKAE